MTLELDKKDLISLVKGNCPNYNAMDNTLVKQNGNYVGGFNDRWDWNTYNLEKLSEQELHEIYLICKNSWK